jgi:putative ABC transport system ATP-binding protein
MVGNLVFEARNITKTYRSGKRIYRANQDICLVARQGELIGIQGKSGAGKSTFLNIISGLDTPDAGCVRWDDAGFTEMSAARRADFRLEHCGIVFQFFELLRTQSAYQNAALPLKLQGKGKKEIDARLLPWFEKYDLLSIKDKKVHELSGGEKQRIAIIRALSGAPRFIMADEITASLNEELSKRVYEDLKQRIKSAQGAGIFVTHDPVMAAYMDRMYTMSGGTLEPAS